MDRLAEAVVGSRKVSTASRWRGNQDPSAEMVNTDILGFAAKKPQIHKRQLTVDFQVHAVLTNTIDIEIGMNR